MKKKVLSIAVLSVSAALMTTAAEARPDLRNMSCAKAQNLVRQHGAVVFTTGRYTYSMFVSNLSYCDPGQVLNTQYGPTRDNPKCPVAYQCIDPLYERGFRRW